MNEGNEERLTCVRLFVLLAFFCSKELLSEGADGGADGGEAVAAGGRERARKMKEFDRVGVGGEDLCGRGAGVKIGEEGDQSEDDGRVGGGAEVAEAVAEFADEPDV